MRSSRRSEDQRGSLHVALDASQLLPDDAFGELYVVRSAGPGIRRGDHLHRGMAEWFAVVEGSAELQLLDPSSGDQRSLQLDAERPEVVRVPAGLGHCLVSRGLGPMTAVVWAGAPHDPEDVIPCPCGL